MASAQGNTTGYAQIVDKDGEPLGNPEFGAPVFGGNWDEDEATNPFTIADGSCPHRGRRGGDRPARALRTPGFEPGDRATVLVQGGPIEVTVTGIVTFGSADSPGGASVVLFPLETAQRLVGEPGMFDEIAVVAEDGISQEEIVSASEAGLPDGVEAVTGATVTEETRTPSTTACQFINTFLLVFAVIALLVGAFIIFNTFFITVAQRTRENALLRALGAKKRQVLVSVLVEALAVGSGRVRGRASAAGLLVAAGLKALPRRFGNVLPAGGIVVTSSTIVTGLVAGVVVTLVAAISPAARPARCPGRRHARRRRQQHRVRLEAAGDRRARHPPRRRRGAAVRTVRLVRQRTPGGGPGCPDHVLRRDRAGPHGLPAAQPGHRLAARRGCAASRAGWPARTPSGTRSARRRPRRR